MLDSLPAHENMEAFKLQHLAYSLETQYMKSPRKKMVLTSISPQQNSFKPHSMKIVCTWCSFSTHSGVQGHVIRFNLPMQKNYYTNNYNLKLQWQIFSFCILTLFGCVQRELGKVKITILSWQLNLENKGGFNVFFSSLSFQ